MGLDEIGRRRAEELFGKAVNLYNKGHYDRAASIFQELLDEYRSQCNVGDMNYWLGCCHHQLDNTDEAITHLTIAYDASNDTTPGPGYMATIHFLASSYWNRDENERALALLEEGERYFRYYDPTEHYAARFAFRKLKGDVYSWVGERRKAIEQYQLAQQYISENDREKHVKNADMLYSIGRAYHYEEEHEIAAEYLSRVQMSCLDESSQRGYHRVMERHSVRTRDYSKALEHFQTLKQMGIPEHWVAEVYNFAGRAYYYLSDGSNARKCFEESKRHPSDEGWLEKSNNAFLEELEKAGH